MKTKDKSHSGSVEKTPGQLPLDFKASQPQTKPTPAEVVPISRQRTSNIRDVLVGDLIASKVPKKS